MSAKSRLTKLWCLALLAIASVLVGWSPTPGAKTSYFDGISQSYIAPQSLSGQTLEVAAESTGAMHGAIFDESDSPLQTLQVELIPADKHGDAQWYATKRAWTDAAGQYDFKDVAPGEYYVAVLKHGAPDARHPFAGLYYPGADNETGASRILVTAASSMEVPTIRLRRLETVTLKVSVAFEDGIKPAWSNLLFHNISYPDQAIIGDEAPGIENGHGEFTLPKGFEYYASAKVDCDAGPQIDTRESRPMQRIKIEDEYTPEKLVFTIPGPACKLWSPK